MRQEPTAQTAPKWTPGSVAGAIYLALALFILVISNLLLVGPWSSSIGQYRYAEMFAIAWGLMGTFCLVLMIVSLAVRTIPRSFWVLPLLGTMTSLLATLCNVVIWTLLLSSI